jgi:hypothetical protein
MLDREELRRSFLPQHIETLFVGESPPEGDAFFNKGKGLLHNKLKESLGCADLAEFKANGFYLDDLVLYPINKMGKKERDEHRREGISSLAERIACYKPKAIVVFVKSIESMVIDAVRRAGLRDVPVYVTPFPRHQKRFKEKMEEIVPNLPIANS